MGLSERMLRPIRNRIDNMIMRAVVSLINDKTKAQTLQVQIISDDDVKDDVEHFQSYGITFRPPRGSEALVFSVGGRHDHLVALGAMDRTVRPTNVSDGEGGLYNATGFKVFLAADNVVHLAAKSAASPLARSDRVEAELNKIKAALDAVSAGGGKLTGANTYLSVGSVGADKVRGT